MTGVYQHCSEAHLHRYLAEFDFRYSNRIKLGVDDTERTRRAIKGAGGKRLTYRRTRSQAKEADGPGSASVSRWGLPRASATSVSIHLGYGGLIGPPALFWDNESIGDTICWIEIYVDVATSLLLVARPLKLLIRSQRFGGAGAVKLASRECLGCWLSSRIFKKVLRGDGTVSMGVGPMKKEHAALLRRRRSAFSPAEYAKEIDEIAKASAERFSRGSINTNLLTEDALNAERAQRRKQIEDTKKPR